VDGVKLKKRALERLFHKREIERIETCDIDPSFKAIKFLVCDICFFKLSGSSVNSEAEINAAKYKAGIERIYLEKKDNEETEKYIKYLRDMYQRKESRATLGEIKLPDIM
jgi:hypothetical protein